MYQDLLSLKLVMTKKRVAQLLRKYELPDDRTVMLYRQKRFLWIWEYALWVSYPDDDGKIAMMPFMVGDRQYLESVFDAYVARHGTTEEQE